MATILAHIRVKPGMEQTFEQLAASLYRDSHARDPGVHRYEYWRGQDERTYYTLLAFEDYGAFITHQSSDHHEAATPALRDAVEELRLEWVDPLPDASPLPPTAAGPLADGAGPLAVTQAGRFPAGVASWWAGVGERRS